MQVKTVLAGLLAGPTCVGALQACTTFSTDDPPAATAEGGVPRDATGVDGGRFCDAHRDAALCSDFDGMGDPLVGWGKFDGRGGELISDLTSFVSPPRALRARVTGSGTDTMARLAFDVPNTSSRTHLSFDVRLTEPTIEIGRFMAVAEILCANTSPAKYEGAWLHWRRFDSGMKLGIATGTTFTPIVGIPTGRWVRLELDARWGDAKVIVRLDGAEIASPPLTATCASFASALVNIGAFVYGGTFTGGSSFDNVVVEYER